MNAQETKIKPLRPQKKTGTKTVEGVIVGRDQIVIPPEDIRRLAELGCNDREIADWFGIDNNTLRYNFSVELLKGRETLKHKLRRAQLKVALAGNVTMLIFLGKNYLGQSDSPTATADLEPLPWVE